MIVNGYKIEPGADLTNADFSGADLTNADLTGATMPDGKRYDSPKPYDGIDWCEPH